MGVLSIGFKTNFLGLLKYLNKLNWLIVFLSLINLSVCIYEDQIGKFDWRQSYVGRIKFAQFDTVSTAKKLIVATEENVLAALNLKTGQVVWRHVFESASTGNIQLLDVTDKVVTVSGSNPYLVRGWDSTTGVLLWEWSLTLQNDETAEFSEWWVQNGLLVHMLPVFGSHVEVTMYILVSGSNRGSTSKMPAQWVNDGCVISKPYYTCVSGNTGGQLLISFDVTSNAVQIISKPVSDYITPTQEINLRPLDGNSGPGFILDDQKVLLIKENQFEVLKISVGDPAASIALVDAAAGAVLLQTWTDHVKGFKLTAHSVNTGETLPEIQTDNRNVRLPDPEITTVLCTKARDHNICRILLTAADDSTHLMQQGGRIIWSREEALANIVAAEFVDLPVSDLDAAIESEFDQKEGSIWAAFSRRLHTQYQQLQALIQSMQVNEPTADEEPTQLHRDYFNLHKIIVLVTDCGKIFGMDNLSGAILWHHYEPSLDTEKMQMFTRRSARHPPHDAYLTIVGKHVETGNTLIVSLNPISGALVGEKTLHLKTQPLQCALLHNADKTKLHALILLDSHENIHVFPETAASLVENMFLYVAEKQSAKLQGYALKYDGQKVLAVQTWSVVLGGGVGRIASLSRKPAGERVHSLGRVLGDRSVLYKYSNPNLLLVVVQAPDPLHKDMVIAACIDGASGAVVSSQVHRRARATPLAVHTDNSLAYVYYNDKHRRTEVATMELYEGKTRWSVAGAPFSSLEGARAPQTERLAYILSATPTAAETTRTERSLTDKHVLMALTTGAIVEMPWIYLEPRRPVSPTQVEREEGLIPYAPELPLPSEAVLNYNMTLQRVKAIYTAPSGLESTSLVLATGLDLFYTRVAPSKTFDLLKDDFDYYLITVVLTALIVATYSTKYFASRKMLKMAWNRSLQVTDDEESTVATAQSSLTVDEQPLIVTQQVASASQQPGTSRSDEPPPSGADANAAAEPFAGVSPQEEDQPGERDYA